MSDPSPTAGKATPAPPWHRSWTFLLGLPGLFLLWSWLAFSDKWTQAGVHLGFGGIGFEIGPGSAAFDLLPSELPNGHQFETGFYHNSGPFEPPEVLAIQPGIVFLGESAIHRIGIAHWLQLTAYCLVWLCVVLGRRWQLKRRLRH